VFQIDASSGDYVYFALCPVAAEFVSLDLAGGTVRSYRIEITDAGGTQSPGGDPGAGGGDDPGAGGGTPPGEIEERSELFTADASGRIVFYTNETKYKNHDYTFWRRLEGGAGSFSGMTMSLIKESGNQAGGYGFFFQGGVVGGRECMLTVLLQKDGNYTIGKVVDGTYYTLKWWTASAYLRAGYGVTNTVGVRWEETENEYVLEINGIQMDRFSDAEAPVCAGSGRGVIAVIAAGEQFPKIPVKVWFMEQ
jgi:hypothetical protein